ncbi:hypothetical protein ACQP06_09220 [Nocardia sp. CA-136227]|uniref:hypothetical protein n=1 Tax=Nocardia sp. CA-136227 TaxID=3239979 RepID=UPI003D96993D
MRDMWCPSCDSTLPVVASRCPFCSAERPPEPEPEQPPSYWLRVFVVALIQVGLPIAVGVGIQAHVVAAAAALGFAVSAMLWSLVWAAATPQD